MANSNKLNEEGPELASAYFFNSPGPDNTSKVIEVVGQRVRLGDIAKILVASESGQLALELRRSFARATIVCVTYNDETRRKYQKPALMKDQLLGQRIVLVDTVPEPLGRELTFRNW